ncbi:MAG: hypothetical protein IPI81_02730 [Flavobacteriales bacterium]|nr:hypothetical protein [Flavobacteriales bacterium]MCC6936985.1 hypothetical protein [Flavobacteriales bacterium]
MKPVRSLVLGFAVVLSGSSALAQSDTSLTREFKNLSAKERARIAKKEQVEAAADPRYQAVMAQAESRFQAKQYDEALESFKEARTLRPLNVYPKVKIQDLQVLIAKRDQALSEPLPPSVKGVAPLQGTSDVVRSDPHQTAVVETHGPDTTQPRMTPPAHETRKDPAARSTTVAPQKEPLSIQGGTESPLPDGMEERTYVEGRAVVLERRLVRNGRLEVYRKVTHPWGQVVHFRDGIAISEREWSEVFH